MGDDRRDPHWHYWGAGFLAVGLAFIGIAALNAAEPKGAELWTTWEAVVGYVFLAAAVGCGICAGFQVPFPIHPRSNSAPARDQGEAQSAEEDRLSVECRYVGSDFIVSVINNGPTITDGKINVLAPYRVDQRVWVYRKEWNESPVGGDVKTDVIAHALTPDAPQAVRWRETHLEIHGYTTTEWRLFLPRVDGDPIEVRIGSDELEGWRGWTYETPRSDPSVEQAT